MTDQDLFSRRTGVQLEIMKSMMSGDPQKKSEEIEIWMKNYAEKFEKIWQDWVHDIVEIKKYLSLQ